MIRAPKGVRALFSDVNKVGKRIKASKKKFTWKFSVDSREHTVDMYVSTLTGKRKVLVDGDLVYSGKSQSGVYFHYPLKIDRVMVAIEQLEDSWDLKIGGVSFVQLAAMRPSAAESKDADWGAAQEWKSDKESEFGPVHNKWDDWDKPKPQPKAEEPRASQLRDQESSEEEEESWGSRRPGEREIRTNKPAAREEYDWDPKGFPQEEEEYPQRYERRGERPPRREPVREDYYRRDDDRYRREDEYRSRPRDEEPRARPRDEEPKARPRDEDWRRHEDERYREEPRRPGQGREQDYRSRLVDPPKKPREFEQYERPKPTEFDPFEIHDAPQRVRQEYNEEEEEENLYPSLSSLDAKRQSQQPVFPPYQPPPVSDPFSAPVSFAPAAANVFSPPQSLPQTPADFKVASSRPFDDDPFLAPAQPPPKKTDADIANLVDLDGLNLGDDYSPAVTRKREEQNRAVSIGVATPNVPMNQLKPTGPPNIPNPMMTAPMMGAPMMPNPMAAAMMMQSYMTGMMMNSMMMNQGVPQQRYF